MEKNVRLLAEFDNYKRRTNEEKRFLEISTKNEPINSELRYTGCIATVHMYPMDLLLYK